MKNDRIILAVIIPLLFVSSGYYYLVTHPPQNLVKEIVAMPVVYAGNLTYLYWSDYGVTYGNDTPLAKYWYTEYLKTHTWSVERDGISLVIYPKYITGDYETEAIGFIVVLNSSKYIERVKYISNATEMAIKNGGDILVGLVDGDYYDKREYWRELNLPGDPSVAEIVSWHIGMSNVSFECRDYVDIHERKTKEPLPYNFTAYVETKDKIYRFDFLFNITAKYYPFIDLWHTYYVPNATYFCYIPSENKVVISDHIVEGTKYFFVEKDGFLSRIVEVRR